MRSNDKVLLENVNDYFTHKGMPPKLIDDIKENIRNDFKKSEEKKQDYLDFRGKSTAQIILIIQRNLFGLHIYMISNTFHSKLQPYYLCFIVLLFSRLLFLFIYKLLEKNIYIVIAQR